MPVVEFLGLPRAGKSTLAARIQAEDPTVVVHHETYDTDPAPGDGFVGDERFIFNLRHLQKILRRTGEVFELAKSDGNIHIVERGPLDRGNFFIALMRHGLITAAQYAQAAGMIDSSLTELQRSFGNPVGYDKAYLFNPPIDVSLERIKRPKPGNIMQDRAFLEVLRRTYEQTVMASPNVAEMPVVTYQNVDNLAQTVILLNKPSA